MSKQMEKFVVRALKAIMSVRDGFIVCENDTASSDNRTDLRCKWQRRPLKDI